MRIDYLIIGLVIFGVFITGGAFILTDVNNNYNVGMDINDISQNLSTQNEMFNVSQSTKDAVVGGEISDVAAWESMQKGAYIGTKTSSTPTYRSVNNILTSVTSRVGGIPPFFVDAVMIILSVAIAFAIIYALLRYYPR